MHTTERSSTQFRLTAVCTVTDPAERQRRLGRVYGLTPNSGHQQRAAREETSSAPTQPANDEAATIRGG
jgi:transposase-like protein